MCNFEPILNLYRRAVQVVSQSNFEHFQKTLIRAVAIFTQLFTAFDHICATWYDYTIVVHNRVYGLGITCYHCQHSILELQISVQYAPFFSFDHIHPMLYSV